MNPSECDANFVLLFISNVIGSSVQYLPVGCYSRTNAYVIKLITYDIHIVIKV